MAEVVRRTGPRCAIIVRPRGQVNNRIEGTVVEAVPNNLFRVRLVDGRRVLAHIGDEARVSLVRLVPGDRVLLELTVYDLSRARIVARAGGRSHESIGLG